MTEQIYWVRLPIKGATNKWCIATALQSVLDQSNADWPENGDGITFDWGEITVYDDMADILEDLNMGSYGKDNVLITAKKGNHP